MKVLSPPASEQQDRVRQQVREHYGKIAEESGCGCSPSCCGGERESARGGAAQHAQRVGYSLEQTATAPEGANLGLSCGNPLAIAALLPGQTVLDLGSGAGFDAFLAARAVGPQGKVIGVDMTPAMISRARGNAAKADVANVEFRLGEIENLPVADRTVDVILSNCVINLSPDKGRVFAEAWRVLKAGGRLAISDVVALRPVPQGIRENAELYASCASGAAQAGEIEAILESVGFANILVRRKPESAAVIEQCFPGKALEQLFASATIEAVKPGHA